MPDRRVNPPEIKAGSYSGPDRRHRDERNPGRRADDKRREWLEGKFDERDKKVRRGQRRRDITVFAALGLALIAIGENQKTSRHADRNASSTKNALCSFKGDLEQRVSSTIDFLAKHPNGIPGIPVGTLHVSLQNSQKTLASLAPLSCPKPPKSRRTHSP